MKVRVLRMMMLAAATLLAAWCVRAEGTMSGEVFQTFEFGNDGRGVIDNVKVQYGDFVIPTRTANNEFGPNHMVTFSETMTIPIPETAAIRWTSADGKEHDVIAPIRSFVDDPRCFYGLRFFFVDDRVDIYVMNRKIDCTRLLGVERTKVFSSKPGR